MDKKNRIKRAYNETANFYNSRYKEIQYEKYRSIFASPYLSAENLKCKILDLGCGTGLLLEFFKESKLPYIVGIDISAEMLKFSKEEKILGDVEMLPFKDNSFDLAFSFTVIQNLPTLKILEEVSRILKPDSIFAFTVLKKKLPTELLQNLAKNKLTILEKLDSNEDCGFICRNEKNSN